MVSGPMSFSGGGGGVLWTATWDTPLLQPRRSRRRTVLLSFLVTRSEQMFKSDNKWFKGLNNALNIISFAQAKFAGETDTDRWRLAVLHHKDFRRGVVIPWEGHLLIFFVIIHKHGLLLGVTAGQDGDTHILEQSAGARRIDVPHRAHFPPGFLFSLISCTAFPESPIRFRWLIRLKLWCLHVCNGLVTLHCQF